MRELAASLAIFAAGALGCLAAARRPAVLRLLGPATAVGGCIVALVPATAALMGRSSPALSLPWQMPYGALAVQMDALSAVFALPILAVAALAAIYGAQYLRPFESQKNLGACWCFYNLLTASMLLVVVARNAMLFLLAWELMSLSSFFLVMFEHERDSVRRAGWTYLVATHVGTAFLLVMFAMLGRPGGGLDFTGFAGAGGPSAAAGAVFVLAIIGFGTKAGFIPLHVWLPEAHPAAPSHVSAVMSGVMIKTGIYGLLRVLTFLGPPAIWWGWTLIAVGAVSGVLGVLFALAQHDLKRLLAYHSVENIGIIALGLGVGLLGISYGNAAMAFLGFAGGLLHVINHAVFKSLLFLGAGSILHATGTREIDHLGGLLKRMPATGVTFLIGSAAICGLPPLNGFVSELMIYLAALSGLAARPSLPLGALVAGPVVLAALALIGGLALACFTKAFGIIFLGEPRSEHARHAHEPALAMRLPTVVLAAACVVVGVCGPVALRILRPAIDVLVPKTAIGGSAAVQAAAAMDILRYLTFAALGLAVVVVFLGWLRQRLLQKRPVTPSVTWDCGYASPTPRMQYTASSFARPITRLFRVVLRTQRHYSPPAGFFPQSSSFSSDTPDVYQESLYRPAFAVAERLLARFRVLQHGRVNLYVLCIVLALLALLAWKLR